MFNRAIHTQVVPKYLSSDHDPLYQFHQWQANLRVLEIQEIKTVPYVPLSHPFVERLIGTIRREYLDQILFWTATDLEKKLPLFQDHFNRQRVPEHAFGSFSLQRLGNKEKEPPSGPAAEREPARSGKS